MGILAASCATDRQAPAKLSLWLAPRTTTSTEASFQESYRNFIRKSTPGINTKSKSPFHTSNFITKLYAICSTKTTTIKWVFRKTQKGTWLSKDFPKNKQTTKKKPSKCYFKAKITAPSLSINLTEPAPEAIAFLQSTSRSEAKSKALKK